MEELILTALSKRNTKGRPINVSVPKQSEKPEKMPAFDPVYEERPNEVQIGTLLSFQILPPNKI